MNDRTVDLTTYLHIGETYPNRWGRTFGVRKHSNKRPAEPMPGCVVVKIRIRLPEAAFDPLAPEVIVDIPADLIQHPVSVTAEDANP